MKKRSAFLFIIATLLLASCSSIKRLDIDTYLPSEIIFPKKVDKVLLVNNAVAQPENSGYEFTLFGVNQDTCRFKVDSALFDACKALGEKILEEDFFSDVLLFHESTRKDSTFYLDTKLTPTQVAELCEETGTDAIISIDRMIFGMKKDISDLGDGTIVGVIKVDVSGVVRGYIPERGSSLASVVVSDSVFYAETAYDLKILNAFLPNSNDAIREASKYFGSRLYRYFAPHWKTETRWYYTQLGNNWLEASAYAASEKWKEAGEKWSLIYKRTNNWKTKAKAASNIALAFEMQDDLDKALEWANISADFYDKQKDKESTNSKLQEYYVKALTNRIMNKHKLNVQFGEK